MDNKFVGRFDKSMLQNFEEFEKRYLNTWVWMEHNKVGGFWKYSGHGYAESQVRLVFENKERGNLFVPLNTDFEISVVVPDAGMFNSPLYKQSLVFSRRPQRQFRRGLCSDNISIDGLIVDIGVPRDEIVRTQNYEPLLAHALEKRHVPFDDAIKGIEKNERVSTAVSTMFAVSRPIIADDDRPCLWMYRTIVGVLDTTKKTVVCDPLFCQEVNDLLKEQSSVWTLEKSEI